MRMIPQDEWLQGLRVYLHALGCAHCLDAGKCVCVRHTLLEHFLSSALDTVEPT